MNRDYIFIGIAVGILAVLCVLDVMLGKWIELCCNGMWIMIAVTVGVLQRRLAERDRELLFCQALNKKLTRMLSRLAVESGRKGSEVSDMLAAAITEAGKETSVDIDEKDLEQ